MSNFLQSLKEQFGEIHQITINNRVTHLRGEDNFKTAIKLLNEKSSQIKSFYIVRIDGLVKLKVRFDYAE